MRYFLIYPFIPFLKDAGHAGRAYHRLIINRLSYGKKRFAAALKAPVFE
jgi:hypothetical protein